MFYSHMLLFALFSVYICSYNAFRISYPSYVIYMINPSLIISIISLLGRNVLIAVCHVRS
jgi:hypothetical protein